MSAQGFGAVIYLAPPTVHDAIADEAAIVRKQGLDFVNIPIPFGKPTEADFESFVAAMNQFRDRKVRGKVLNGDAINSRRPLVGFYPLPGGA